MTNKLKNLSGLTRGAHLHWCVAFLLALTMAPAAFAEESTPKAQSRFAKLDGARIHYVNYGKGHEALVLVHGWTSNLEFWRDQIADFSRRNRVIAIDLPGHGLSDKPQTVYSMDFFARAVDAVLRDATLIARCWWATAWARRRQTVLSQVSGEDSGDRHCRRLAATFRRRRRWKDLSPPFADPITK